MRHSITIFCLLVILSKIMAQTPMIKVDFNMENRQASEVNDPDYTSWFVARVHEASMTEKGITFTVTAKTPGMSPTFRSYWSKAYVQSPNLMRLIGDGLMVDKDSMTKYPASPAAMELKVSGLAVGTHTLQTYHNMWDDTTTVNFAPMNFYLNGVLVKSGLKRTVKVMNKALATVLLTPLHVTQPGQDMILRIEADPNYVPSSSKIKDYNFCINAFELNADDASKLAHTPTPANKDFHVVTNAGTDTLKWKPSANGYTKLHSLFIGTDSASVANATTASADIFKGTFPVTTTEYQMGNLYNMNTYYWRVDETDSANIVTKGAVWSFRPQHLAFPGAEGYGRDAIGGRGGKVVYVTNLNDNGPGSFREAVTSDIGPRTVLFAVSGLITLNSRLTINKRYITVAGQTAPGKGVCFRWAPIGAVADDLILQHIRMRLGIGVTYDGIGLTGADHSIIDHASISWTIDEAFSSRGAKNITLQNTLISEALNVAGHQNYPDGKAHGFAGSVGGDVGSLHHNLLAHCNGRNWSLAGGLTGDGYYAGKMDIFNMVVYNWGGRTTDGGANQVNFVNNYYKKGPACDNNMMLTAQLEGLGKGSQAYYYTGNILENVNKTFACDGTDNSCARTYQKAATQVLDWEVWVTKPFFPSYATITSAKDAYKQVLSDVGCTQPVLDDHDKRVINETLIGTTSCKGSRSGIAGLPDHEGDVGGWENYPGYNRATNWDTDLDGLPDWWETSIGTNPNSASGSFADSNADTDRNGYTNLEEYLHWMSNPHYFTEAGKKLSVDLSQYTKGYSNQPVFRVSNPVNGSVALVEGKTAEFTPTSTGLCEFAFTVQDAEGSTFTKKVGVFAGTLPADEPFTYTYYKDRAMTQQVSVSPSGILPVKNSSVLSIVSYPNPVKNELNIKFESSINTEADFIIYNTTGVEIHRVKKLITGNTNHFTFDLNKYLTGVYTLRVKNGSMNETVKFVKL